MSRWVWYPFKTAIRDIATAVRPRPHLWAVAERQPNGWLDTLSVHRSWEAAFIEFNRLDVAEDRSLPMVLIEESQLTMLNQRLAEGEFK